MTGGRSPAAAEVDDTTPDDLSQFLRFCSNRGIRPSKIKMGRRLNGVSTAIRRRLPRTLLQRARAGTAGQDFHGAVKAVLDTGPPLSRRVSVSVMSALRRDSTAAISFVRRTSTSAMSPGRTRRHPSIRAPRARGSGNRRENLSCASSRVLAGRIRRRVEPALDDPFDLRQPFSELRQIAGKPHVGPADRKTDGEDHGNRIYTDHNDKPPDSELLPAHLHCVYF